MPAILAGAQLFEDLDLVQALSVSTTVPNGLGETLAADRMLISGQDSAIFDLALLAPGLISPDSSDEIAFDGAPSPVSASLNEDLPLSSSSVEMPTVGGDSSTPLTSEHTIKALSLSGDPLPEGETTNSDAALTQALAALAALEQTGRSSLSLQKARPDLLPSILKSRLGIEARDNDLASTAPEHDATLSKFPTFFSTSQKLTEEAHFGIAEHQSPETQIKTVKDEKPSSIATTFAEKVTVLPTIEPMPDPVLIGTSKPATTITPEDIDLTLTKASTPLSTHISVPAGMTFEIMPSSKLPRAVMVEDENVPSIDEARREDRPAFIGELVETPKPIILPNQPMPIVPRAPLLDPAIPVQHPALVFTNEAGIESAKILEHNFAIQAAVKTQISTQEPLIIPAATITTDLVQPNQIGIGHSLPNENDHISFVSYAETRNATVNEKNIELAEAPTPDFSDFLKQNFVPTHVSLKAPVPMARVMKNTARDGMNGDGLISAHIETIADKRTINETSSEAATHENDTLTSSVDVSTGLTAALINTVVQPASVPTLVQEALLSSEGEPTHAESSARNANQFGLSAPSTPDPSAALSMQTSIADVSRKIEQLASQQDAEPQTENDFSSTILNENSALQIDDVDKSTRHNAVLSEFDWSHDASTISFDQDNDTHESLLAFKDQSDSHELIATSTSIVDEKIEAKKSTPSTESVSTSKSDMDDNSDAALIEVSKKSIEPVEPSESLSNSIRDVTVMASHSNHAEDSGVTFTGHTPSSVPSDYRSGYSSTHAASARENLVASTYVSTDNPLFQIQRDRAVEAQVIAALKAGRDEVRLSLYPPQLGQVTINLALDGHKVKVALKTSSREATDLLTSEQPSLTHALHLEGFSLEGFDVTEDGPQDNHKEDRDHTIITPIPASSGSSEFSIDITI